MPVNPTPKTFRFALTEIGKADVSHWSGWQIAVLRRRAEKGSRSRLREDFTGGEAPNDCEDSSEDSCQLHSVTIPLTTVRCAMTVSVQDAPAVEPTL